MANNKEGVGAKGVECGAREWEHNTKTTQIIFNSPQDKHKHMKRAGWLQRP